jgi:hypothetical protein
MRKSFVLVAVLALLCSGSLAQAAKIQGSTSWNIFGSITGADPTFTLPQPPAPLSGMYVNPGTGDFVAVPNWVGPPMNLGLITWLTSSTLNVNSPAGWTFGSPTFGTWVTTGGTATRSNGFLNLSLQGVFTPGTMFGGKTQSQGIMTIGFIMNSNHTASNVSGTMAMVAEPSSIIALLGGLGSLLALRRRTWRA